MIIVLRPDASASDTEQIRSYLNSKGAELKCIDGEYRCVLGVVGCTDGIDAGYIEGLSFVESVTRISEPYRLSGRLGHPADSVIDICGRKIGGGNFEIIAGPCSVESEDQICSAAEVVKACGAGLLRGGAFKPRTSPYEFQGLGTKGLELLKKAKRLTGLPTVTEIMLPEQLPLFEDVDVIQVGARNMQNFELLKELGKAKKPILLKRGWSNTIKELLTSAEYIIGAGNSDIILCERGIRTFEPYTRNTLDLSAVPVIHELSHLPVIVDPSHATGHSGYVGAMALAAVAAGADGLMIEVHPEPCRALCDAAQAITPAQFSEIVTKVNAVRKAIGK